MIFGPHRVAASFWVGWAILLLGVWGLIALAQRVRPQTGEVPPVVTTSATPTSTSTSTAPPAPAVDGTGLGLTLPNGFRIETFAQGFREPRVLFVDQAGVVVVGDQAAGTVVALADGDHDGRADTREILLAGLSHPRNFAFLPGGQILIAENQRTAAWRYDSDAKDWVVDHVLAAAPAGANPAALFFAHDALYIADDAGGRIFRITPLDEE